MYDVILCALHTPCETIYDSIRMVLKWNALQILKVTWRVCAITELEYKCPISTAFDSVFN